MTHCPARPGQLCTQTEEGAPRPHPPASLSPPRQGLAHITSIPLACTNACSLPETAGMSVEVLSGPGVLHPQGGRARCEVSLHGESHLLGPLSVTPRFRPLATAPTCPSGPHLAPLVVHPSSDPLALSPEPDHTARSPSTSSCLTPGMSLLVALVTQSSLIATPWAVARQAPLSMGFSRQESWSGLPFPFPGGLTDPGIEPRSPAL